MADQRRSQQPDRCPPDAHEDCRDDFSGSVPPAQDQRHPDEGCGSRHADRHRRAPGRWGHDDRRKRYRERDGRVSTRQAADRSLTEIEGREQVVLEYLGGEVRPPDNDEGTQRQVEPASHHSQRHAGQQRQADRTGRHLAQSSVKEIQHQHGAADGVRRRTVQAYPLRGPQGHVCRRSQPEHANHCECAQCRQEGPPRRRCCALTAPETHSPLNHSGKNPCRAAPSVAAQWSSSSPTCSGSTTCQSPCQAGFAA